MATIGHRVAPISFIPPRGGKVGGASLGVDPARHGPRHYAGGFFIDNQVFTNPLDLFELLRSYYRVERAQRRARQDFKLLGGVMIAERPVLRRRSKYFSV